MDDPRFPGQFERESMAWPPEPATPVIPLPRRRWRVPVADRAFWTDLAQTAGLSVLLFLALRPVARGFAVESVSMEPTLVEGQQIWVEHISQAVGRDLARGDIVVFQAWGQDKPFVKRVVGLPGETVEVRDGRVSVDGVSLDEPYLQRLPGGPDDTRTLGADEVYVLGDNRANSADSRTYGPLPLRAVMGRAWLRYWPPRQVHLLVGPRPLLASH